PNKKACLPVPDSSCHSGIDTRPAFAASQRCPTAQASLIKMSSSIPFVDLSNTSPRINQGGEVRIFKFIEIAGSGRRDSFTWKAVDRYGTPFAIKLVPKSHYESHSIEGELRRTRTLGPRFAKVLSYGELVPEDATRKEWASQFYSIVVE